MIERVDQHCHRLPLGFIYLLRLLRIRLAYVGLPRGYIKPSIDVYNGRILWGHILAVFGSFFLVGHVQIMYVT